MPETGQNQSRETRDAIVLDRRSIDAITSYEVTEDQLVMIETSSSSTELNYSIALLSVCASLVVTLSTTKIEGTAKVAVFWSAMIICAVLGSYFAVEYRKKRKNSTNIFVRIRAQKSTNALRDSVPPTSLVAETSDEQSS